MWSPCVPVAAVSVGGGGFCSSFFLPVGATVSVAVGAVWVGGGAAVSVLLFIGGFVVVGWVERGRGRGPRQREGRGCVDVCSSDRRARHRRGRVLTGRVNRRRHAGRRAFLHDVVLRLISLHLA